MSEQAIWGIHPGEGGAVEDLFLRRSVIAIGWPNMGDLSQYPDREAYKASFPGAYPGEKPGAIPTKAGQLYRFVHEMQVGDLVVCPLKLAREVRIGRTVGEYQHLPDVNARYPNMRKVEWLKSVPRTSFSQGALYEMGSALTLFQISSHADEVIAHLEGRDIEPVDEDEDIAEITSDIEEQTRDFVLKQLARRLKGHPFEQFVAHLLEKMGYRTRVSAVGTDHGIDIIAHRDELGFEPPLVKVQVKSMEGSVGEPVVSALYGKVGDKEFGLLVTLGSLTKQAVDFAFSKGNLRLIDGDELVDLIFEHYDELDPRYQGMIPLKRVYVPEAVSEA
jgi:restriction system protein